MADETPRKLQDIANKMQATKEQSDRHHRETLRELQDQNSKLQDQKVIEDVLGDILDTTQDGVDAQKKQADKETREQARRDEQEREFRRSFLGILSNLGKDIKSSVKESQSGIAGLALALGAITAGLGTGLTVAAFVGQLRNWYWLLIKTFGKNSKFGRFLRRVRIFFKRTIPNWWGSIKAAFGKKSWLGKLWTGLKSWFGPKSKIGRAFTWLMSKSKTISGIGGLFRGLGRWLSKLWPIFRGAMKIVTKIPIIGQIIALVWGVVEGVINAWDEFAAGNIVNGIIDLFGGFLEVFTFGILEADLFGAWLKGLWADIKDTVFKFLDGDFIGGIIGIGDIIIDGIVGALEFLVDTIVDFVADILEWFGVDVTGLREFVDFDVIQWVKDYFNFVRDWWADWFGEMGSAIGDLWDWMAEKWNSLTSWVGGQWVKFKLGIGVFWSTITGFWDAGKAWVSNKWDNYLARIGWFWDTITDMWDGIKEWMATKWENLKSNISDSWTLIKDKITGVGDFIYDNLLVPVMSAGKWLGMQISWAFRKTMSLFIGAVNGIINWYNDSWIPGPRVDPFTTVDAGGRPTWKDAKSAVTGMEFGGIVSGLGDGIGSLFRLGEKGDELVAPLADLGSKLIDPVMSKGMSMAKGFMESDQAKDITSSLPTMLDKLTGLVPPSIAIGGATNVTSNSNSTTAVTTSVRNNDYSRQVDMNC